MKRPGDVWEFGMDLFLRICVKPRGSGTVFWLGVLAVIGAEVDNGVGLLFEGVLVALLGLVCPHLIECTEKYFAIISLNFE